MRKLALIFVLLVVSNSAFAQQLVPIGRPDHRAVVARLAATLPPSIYGDYIGVTPRGRWCALTVASNGWEYFVTGKQAIPGGFWTAGKPALLTVTASFSLTSSVNPMMVTSAKETAEVLSVSYEQILPPSGVNFQYVTGGSITIYKNQYGRPSRVEVVEKSYDRWNDFVSERRLNCGEPGSEE